MIILKGKRLLKARYTISFVLNNLILKTGGRASEWAKVIAVSYLESSSTLLLISTNAKDYRCFLPDLTDFQKHQSYKAELLR